MTMTIQNTDLITSGTAISLAQDTDLLDTEGTLFASTDGSAILSNLDGNVVFVDGEVFATSIAIYLVGNDNQVFFGETGQVGSSSSFGASLGTVFVGGDNAVLVNHGTVSGGSALTIASGLHGRIENTGRATGTNAIAVDNMDNGSIIQIINSGYAYGSSYGLRQFASSVGSVLTLFNSGTLGGDTMAFGGGVGVDMVYNSGHIIGGVDLAGGNDLFDGRGGTVNGTVFGGAGDDIYVVDSTNVLLSESVGEGTDVVEAFVSWTLGTEFENLSLRGNEDLRGTGNGKANTLAGNSGDNVIRGLGGVDTLAGGEGDDRLIGNHGNDLLDGGTGDDVLRGGAGNDNLIGGNGQDVLNGGLGKDVLTGGAGSDVFRFTKVVQSPNTNQRDVIKDFSQGEDVIDLANIAPGVLSFIGGGAFSGAGQGEARIAVSAGNSLVRIDRDGDGVADMLIKVNNISTLDAFDFML